MFFFFKWVRISPEIDWYHYQGASPAPACIVRHQTMIKAPTSKVSHQSPVCPPCCELLCPTAVRLSIHPCCSFIRPPLAVSFSVLPPSTQISDPNRARLIIGICICISVFSRKSVSVLVCYSFMKIGIGIGKVKSPKNRLKSVSV